MPPLFIHHPEAQEGDAPLVARAGDLVFVGGGIAHHPRQGIPEACRPVPGYPNHWSQINRDLTFVYDTLNGALEQAGSDLRQMMKLNSFHTRAEDTFEGLRLRREWFGSDAPPASTLVLVPELPVQGARALIDGVALAGDAALPRRAVSTGTPGAPMPPHERIWGYKIYSKLVRGGGFVFTSGRTNNVIGGAADNPSVRDPVRPHARNRPAAATRTILDYLRAALADIGADFSHVVKAEIHLDDPRHLAEIEPVWREAFGERGPARSVVTTGFPTDNTIIEVELVAVDPEGPYRAEPIVLDDLGPPLGAEPHAVRAGPYLFLSGQLPTDGVHPLHPKARPDPGCPFHQSPARLQAAVAIDRVERLCAAAGGSLQTVLRRRLALCDLSWQAVVDEVWRERAGGLPPSSVFRTSGPLPLPEAGLQFDVVAWCGEG